MFGSILVFLVVLSILVLVHELGHFWVAKKNGVWVEEFGFGIPPRVFGKKINDTIYSINLLPFGGFVRLHGELSQEGITDKKRAFLFKSKLVKTAIISAGVIMNFILAIVSFSVVYSFSGIPKETDQVKIINVDSNSPAQTAGLIQGDVVKEVDGRMVNKTSDFINIVESKKGERIKLTLTDGRIIVITPRENPPEGQGPLGILISNTEIYYPPLYQRPFVGIYYGFKEAFFWGKNVLFGFGKLFSDLFSGSVPSDIAGPVGIFAVTTQAQKSGILALINLLGVISVNLAILNIIPFPALDGGRLLFIFIEGLFGKKILPKVEATIHAIGMAILLILIMAITIHDVKRLIDAGSISGFLENIVK